MIAVDEGVQSAPSFILNKSYLIIVLVRSIMWYKVNLDLFSVMK